LIQRIKSGNFQQLQSFFFVIDELEERFLTNYHKRKKEGVYYTAKEISKFIVTEALLLLINKKLRRNDADSIQIQKIDEIFNLNSETKQKICKTLLNTTICDPACGSGIFLLNSIDLIFNIIKRLDPSCDKFETKKKLLNNHHGFDINEQAIGLSILKLYKWYFNEEKTEFNEIISQLKENFKQKNTLINTNLGKFDIIIGNPPYGNILNKLEKEYLKEENTFYKDVYCTFLFKALNWSNVVVAFLVPKSFLLRQGYTEFRNGFLAKANLIKIIDIGSKLFKNATNEVQIILYENKHKNNNRDLNIYDFPESKIITYKNQKVDSLRICLNANCPLNLKSKKLFVYTYKKICPYCSLETLELNRIRVKPKPLFFKMINKIEKTGDLNYLNPVAFPNLIRGEEDKGLKLVRKKLKKQDNGTCFFISARNDFRYFFINKNKSFNIEEIEATSLKGNNFEYYLSPKLLIKHNNIIPEAIYTEENVCFTSSIYSLLHHDSNELKFLCSIFNSILIQFYCTYAINNQKNTTINLNQYMIRHIPIVNVDSQIKVKLANKVDEI
ncbi:MAG: Eco57I restriction-modification methylase domain-containing protein, partial [Candidatus Lokiarchaeota archaeon]|nr:Eco57I restriction-modification methylase domain-containing protein [Candidatus Lokiarchaeota archaeon]